MQVLLYALVLLLPILAPVGILYLLLKRWDWLESRRQRRNPLTRDLLRGPGETLDKELREQGLELLSSAMLILVAGPSLGVYFFGAWALSGRHSLANLSLALLAFVGIAIVGWRRIRRLWDRQLRLQVGLDAERAIGQELNYLMTRGFTVFHDVPGEAFNIDHVVVGPPGLFVVETKGRSKSEEMPRVQFDGKVLKFPGWTESKPIEQVVMTSRWLEKWVGVATGQNIRVTPVLAIPGWYIVRTTADTSVLTVNGTNMGLVFEKFGRQRLTPEQVEAVCRQLDQRCRTVEPKAYRPSGPAKA